jgi:hypothetical protein
LQYEQQLDLNVDVKGPAISEKIGGLVNKLRLQRVSQDQAKAITKRHNTPENVQLRLPINVNRVFGMKFPARHALQTLNFSQHKLHC